MASTNVSSAGTAGLGSSNSKASSSALRLIQHKREALWFYRFISIGYDHVFNPGQYTEDMRDVAMDEHANLRRPNLKVVDVGGGTGFTTLGIVRHVDPENVTLIDQSPHQLNKARQKKALKGVNIMEGDAEDLPFPADTFDRYVSAGSIEYWPDPQRGIKEAYRVLSTGGLACIIGPVRPTFWLSRFFADMWMLFPTEQEHGLVIGCSVTGIKTESGDSPLQLGPKAEDISKHGNPILVFVRFLIGTICAAYFFLVPIYMWIKDKIVSRACRSKEGE
ncbi:hypothetical protein ACQ4PT_031343 [Festuca glaucescens]